MEDKAKLIEQREQLMKKQERLYDDVHKIDEELNFLRRQILAGKCFEVKQNWQTLYFRCELPNRAENQYAPIMGQMIKVENSQITISEKTNMPGNITGDNEISFEKFKAVVAEIIAKLEVIRS